MLTRTKPRTGITLRTLESAMLCLQQHIHIKYFVRAELVFKVLVSPEKRGKKKNCLCCKNGGIGSSHMLAQ